MQRSATSTLKPLSASRRRAQAPKRYITVNGVRIRYIEEGAQNPGTPLLMVHGYNGSADYFYPRALPGLATERHVLALDLPGCGLSARMPTYSMESFVDLIASFLDAKRIPRVDLLGHSMGGQFAIAAAAARPERFRRLILVDSAGLPELEKHLWLVPLKMLTDACLRHVRLYPTFIKTGLRGRAPFHGLRLLVKGSIGALLESLALPTLIVWGSHDHIVPLAHGRWMAEHIPNARLAVLHGAGHMPFYQQPEKFKRLVLAFLREEDISHQEETNAQQP